MDCTQEVTATVATNLTTVCSGENVRLYAVGYTNILLLVYTGTRASCTRISALDVKTWRAVYMCTSKATTAALSVIFGASLCGITNGLGSRVDLALLAGLC